LVLAFEPLVVRILSKDRSHLALGVAVYAIIGSLVFVVLVHGGGHWHFELLVFSIVEAVWGFWLLRHFVLLEGLVMAVVRGWRLWHWVNCLSVLHVALVVSNYRVALVASG
jgi:hypothetical protein